MRMKTGPQLKGRQNPSPGGVRSHNQPDVSTQRLRGRAEAPTQGRTRNHPSVAPVPKAKIGVGVADTYHANSRSAVDKKFDRHPHD